MYTTIVNCADAAARILDFRYYVRLSAELKKNKKRIQGCCVVTENTKVKRVTSLTSCYFTNINTHTNQPCMFNNHRLKKNTKSLQFEPEFSSNKKHLRN